MINTLVRYPFQYQIFLKAANFFSIFSLVNEDEFSEISISILPKAEQILTIN